MPDKPTVVIRRKVIVDIEFGHTAREMKLAMALTEPPPESGMGDLRRELRRRLGR